MSLGNRDIFLWESVPRSLQATTMCKKQKNQTKRKSEGFLGWLRKGIFFKTEGRKLKMPVKDQQQSGPSEH